MFGKLHQAFRKVVEIEVTGKRYLGTYFRVAFFGKVRERGREEGRGKERGRRGNEGGRGKKGE